MSAAELQPLSAMEMPKYVVAVALSQGNTYKRGTSAAPVYTCLVVTNSTEAFVLVTVKRAWKQGVIARVEARPCRVEGFEHGFVLELELTEPFPGKAETVELFVAQSGAHTYFPPQRIRE